MSQGSRPYGYAASAPPLWAQSAPSGAGFVRNLAIHSDGTMLCSGDTFPLWLSDVQNTRGKWISTFTVNGRWEANGTFNSGGVSPTGSVIGWSNGLSATGGLDLLGNNTQSFGMWAIAIAPSNSSIIYVFYSGQVFCSQNKGVSWTQVGTISPSTWPAENTNDNTEGCQFDKKLAVHPTNPAIVIAGTPENGFYYTTNGTSGASATWTQPTGTPTSSTVITQGTNTTAVGIAGIVFDPATPNTIYVSVHGSGVWTTTTGVTGTWSLIAGSPASVSGAVVSGGIYFCCCIPNAGTPAQSTTIQSWNGTAWTTVLTAACMSIDVNPNNSTNFIYTTNDGSSNGVVYQFTSSGGVATNSLQYNVSTASAGDCPALQLMPANAPGPAHLFWSTGQCRFDPITSQKIWMCCGIGVFYTTSITSPTAPSAATAINYAPQTKGIGGQVGNVIKSEPGQKGFLLGIFDRHTWVVADPTIEPSTFGIGSLQNNIHPCWDLDYASDGSGTYIAIVAAAQTSGDSGHDSIYSTNRGGSWTKMTAVGTPPWTGSAPQCCAAASSSNWCVQDGTATGAVYFTTNTGVTWGTATGLPSINRSYGQNKMQILCADRVNFNSGGTGIGTFYTAATGSGLYFSTNGGSSFSLAGALPTTFASFPFLTQMQTAPGNAGHVWLNSVTGSTGPGTATHPDSTYGMWYTTNGNTASATWTKVANVEDTWGFGFGAVAPGFTYPTIWIIGWVKVGANPYKYGIWVSKDQASTWTWVTDYPAGIYDYLYRICGDSTKYNRCYVLSPSSSVTYGDNLVF